MLRFLILYEKYRVFLVLRYFFVCIACWSIIDLTVNKKRPCSGKACNIETRMLHRGRPWMYRLSTDGKYWSQHNHYTLFYLSWIISRLVVPYIPPPLISWIFIVWIASRKAITRMKSDKKILNSEYESIISIWNRFSWILKFIKNLGK